MKTFILILFFIYITVIGFSQTLFTNGVYVQDGKTIEVERKVYSFTPKNKPVLLDFSNGLTSRIYTNSDFSINGFFQEVNNTTDNPQRAKFQSSILNATLLSGEAAFCNDGNGNNNSSSNNNSSCVISTPLADVELLGGLYYFKVSDNKVIVFVLAGSLKYYTERNKKENVVTTGYKLIAVPNDIGILENKVSIGAEKMEMNDMKKLSDYVSDIYSDIRIMFIRINGKTVGVNLLN